MAYDTSLQGTCGVADLQDLIDRGFLRYQGRDREERIASAQCIHDLLREGRYATDTVSIREPNRAVSPQCDDHLVRNPGQGEQ